MEQDYNIADILSQSPTESHKGKNPILKAKNKLMIETDFDDYEEKK